MKLSKIVLASLAITASLVATAPVTSTALSISPVASPVPIASPSGTSSADTSLVPSDTSIAPYSDTSSALAKRLDFPMQIGNKLCRWIPSFLWAEFIVQLPEEWWHAAWGPDPVVACEKWKDTFKGVCGFWRHKCAVNVKQDKITNYGWLRMYFTTCAIFMKSEIIEERFKQVWTPLLERGLIDPKWPLECTKGLAMKNIDTEVDPTDIIRDHRNSPNYYPEGMEPISEGGREEDIERVRGPFRGRGKGGVVRPIDGR